MKLATPTVTFKSGKSHYSVVSIDEKRGVIMASRIKAGRRMAGRPQHFPIGSIGKMSVKLIHRG